MERLHRPRQLPEERDRCRDAWARGGAFWQLAPDLKRMGLMTGDPASYCQVEYNAVDGALWWVASDMCDLVAAAMQTVPLDTVLDESMWVDEKALCWFEKPLTMTDAGTGEPIAVDAVAWGGFRMAQFGYGVSISAYQWREEHSRLIPLGRDEWLLSQPLGVTEPPPGVRNVEHFAEGATEDRRLLATLWLLATQPGIADSAMRNADRAEQRRSERKGQRPPPPVRVVDLRRRARSSSKHEPTGRHMTVRTIVTGHWRNVPWGPGKLLRRPVWIAPFVRGPEDAPLVQHATVKMLR